MPTYFSENNTPQPGDSDNRLLHKIAGSLNSAGGGGSTGFGPSDANTTRVTLASDGTLVDILGDVGNGPATNDTGPANFNMLFKRALQNWTSLLGRIPTLGQKTKAGSIPVVFPSDEAVNVFQPFVAAGSGPTIGTSGQPSAQRVTISDDSVIIYSTGGYDNSPPATNDTGNFSILSLLKRGLQNWTVLLNGGVSVNTLAGIGVPRVQATSATAANIVLTTTCRRVSMLATTGTWYSLTGTATAASHYIAAGERLDFSVPASTTISVLQETTAGSVRISELV